MNSEVISSEGVTQSVALVTAHLSGSHERSRLVVTVQLSSLAEDMEAGYREGFGAGLNNLAGVAERTMVLQRVIQAPRSSRVGRLDEPRNAAAMVGAGRLLLPDDRGSTCEPAANGSST